MTFRRLALGIGALAAAAAVGAACGGGTATTAPTQATPTDAGLPSIDRSTFDLDSFGIPSFAIPSLAGDEELEAMLPDSIGGQVVIKASMTGQQFFNIGMGGAAALEDMLVELGATADDLSVAIGSAGTAVVVFAYRIEGVSAEQVFDGLQSALPSGGGGAVSQISVGGRTVIQVSTAGETTYIYLAGDVVFIIGGTVTPELLEDAVSQLPAP